MVTRNEAFGPAGKIAMLRSWQAGQLQAAEPAPFLNLCAQCGKCSAACPASLPLSQVFAMAYSMFKSGKRRRNFLSAFPRIFDAVQPVLACVQRYSTTSLPGARSIGRLTSAWPPLARKGFSYRNKTAQGNQKKVLLFSGCVARRSLPEIASASRHALTLNGCRVLAPDNLHCCGGWHGNGQYDIKAISANLELLAKLEFDILATPCPSCLKTIREIWPFQEVLSPKLKNFAEKLARRSFDINVLLKVKDSFYQENACWHSPCHMAEADVALARKVAGIKFHKENEERLCCGGSIGPFAKSCSSLPSLQKSMQKACRDQAIYLKPAAVITGCPGCVLSLRDAFSKDGIKIQHSVQAYLENLSSGSEHEAV